MQHRKLKFTKKILKYTLGVIGILAISTTLFFLPVQVKSISVAHAQGLPNASGQCPAGQKLADDGLGESACVPDNTPTAALSGSSASPPDPSPYADSLGCFSGNLDLCLSGLVYFIAVQLPAVFVYVASVIFGVAVRLSLDSSAYALTFLSQGWTVSRDMANMAFLFILIYIALIIMFKAETSSHLSTLATVIVIALVVNFSFFATRLVIDGGNIIGVQIYNAIPSPPATADNPSGINQVSKGSLLDRVGGKDLTANIMNTLDVQGLLSEPGFKQWNKANANDGNFSLSRLITLSAIYIAIGIISVILGFAFLVAGTNFLGRIVVLWFCILLSPLAFVTLAIPGMKGIFKKWSDSLIKNTVYPAVFLFSFLFITLLMKALKPTSGGSLLGGLFQPLPNTAEGVFTSDFLYSLGSAIATIAIELFFVILMLKYTLSFADKLGLESAGVANKVAGWGKDRTMDLLRIHGGYPAAKAYQQVVGRGASVLDKKLGRTPFGTSKFGDLLRRDVLRPVTKTKIGPVRTYEEFGKVEGERIKEREDRVRSEEIKEEGSLAKREKEWENERQYQSALTQEAPSLSPNEQVAFEEGGRRSRARRLEELKNRKNSGDAYDLSPAEEHEYQSLTTEFKNIPTSERKALRETASKLSVDEKNRLTHLKGQATKADVGAFEKMTQKEIEELVHIITKDQLATIMKSGKFNQVAKDSINARWDQRGTLSKPFEKLYGSAENSINNFDKIAEELHVMAKNNKMSLKLQRAGSKNMKEFIETTRKSIDDGKKEAEAIRDKARAVYQKSDSTEADKLKYNEALHTYDEYQKLLDKINNLEKARGNVRQNYDSRNKKEFEAGDLEFRDDVQVPTI